MLLQLNWRETVPWYCTENACQGRSFDGRIAAAAGVGVVVVRAPEGVGLTAAAIISDGSAVVEAAVVVASSVTLSAARIPAIATVVAMVVV